MILGEGIACQAGKRRLNMIKTRMDRGMQVWPER